MSDQVTVPKELLEVVAWQDAENQLYTTGEKRQMHGWATDGYPIVELVRLSDAQAIIDGLRGENERIRLNIAEYNEAISCYQSERDQLKADNEAYKKLHDWLKAENEVLTLRVMAGERQELDALKSAPVVMPERKELSIYADEEFHRWLEQLPDEAARLNRSKT